MARHGKRTAQLSLMSVGEEERLSLEAGVRDQEFVSEFDAFAMRHEFTMDESDFETGTGAHRAFAA